MATTATKKVFYDHHGTNDDFIGLLLLLASKNIELIGVSVSPAGCLINDGVEATVKILDFFNKVTIPVGRGHIQGRNPFPYNMRASPKVVSALPQLIHLALNQRQLVSPDAEDVIISEISKTDGNVTMIISGPPTNFVAALEKNPSIKEKISEVVVMGGALTQGNVFQYNHDGSAEWNFYWQPEAAKKLINSGLKISLFTLDIETGLPTDLALLKDLAKQARVDKTNPKFHGSDISDLAAQIWAPTLTVQSGKFQHLLSDVLAVAHVLSDKIVTFKQAEIDISVDTPSEGKIIKGSNKVQIAEKIDLETYRKLYLETLNQNVRRIDLSPYSKTQKRKVYYDHDGNNDDIISLQFVLSMENIELLGISVTPADCLLEDGIESTLRVLSLYGKTNIPVAKGTIYGPNPFPYEWRINGKVMNGMPLMINQKINKNQVVKEPADELIIKILKETKEPITILLTGPCTNLASALRKAPEIAKNIEEVVLMGGAVQVHGNVGQYNHDGTGEWNIYYDPRSAKEVLTSGLKITMFSLDSTNNVPVSMDFLKKLADQKDFPASYLASQLWAPTVKNIPSAEYTYFMWDVLAVAFLGCEQLCTFKQFEIDVEVEGPSEGRTVHKKGNGKWVNVADTVNVDGFFKYYMKCLQKDLNIDLE